MSTNPAFCAEEKDIKDLFEQALYAFRIAIELGDEDFINEENERVKKYSLAYIKSLRKAGIKITTEELFEKYGLSEHFSISKANPLIKIDKY